MCRCIFTRRRHLRKTTTSFTMCTVSNKIKTAGSILTYADIPLPHWRQRRKSHSDAVEITLKKQAYLASIRLRGLVMAANRKTRHDNTLTSRQYGRRAIHVPGDVIFQDGGTVNLSKLGWASVFHICLLSFNICTCASVICNKVHI